VEILVLPDAESAAARAAFLIAELVQSAIKKRGQCSLAVSGGSTPWLMLAHLAELKVDWRHVHLFQVDERVLPEGDSNRNWTHVIESFVARVSIPECQVHAMPVSTSNLEQAAASYEAVLRAVVGTPVKLDIVHLGLGSDGHTASLVPDDPALQAKVSSVVCTNPYQGHRRMTLTFSVLNRARKLLWLVAGTEKRDALCKLLNGDRSIPAGRVRGGDATVIADSAAMGLLDAAMTGP